jgi:hypothetical protein
LVKPTKLELLPHHIARSRRSGRASFHGIAQSRHRGGPLEP